jgi:hypothetical protein
MFETSVLLTIGTVATFFAAFLTILPMPRAKS